MYILAIYSNIIPIYLDIEFIDSILTSINYRIVFQYLFLKNRTVVFCLIIINLIPELFYFALYLAVDRDKSRPELKNNI